jgi:chemotaxis protein methyltransferase CheR
MSILCRNLLIYFDDRSRALAALNNLHESLNPGGFLCLGHSESMARISDRFTLARLQRRNRLS